MLTREQIKANYRYKHPKKANNDAPTENNRRLMTETIYLPPPDMSDYSPSKTREELGNEIENVEWEIQKYLRKECPFRSKCIITALGTYRPKGKVVRYTVEAVFGHPFDDEQREWFRNNVKAIETDYQLVMPS